LRVEGLWKSEEISRLIYLAPEPMQEFLYAETDSLEKSSDPQTEQLETISLKPKKSNIAVKLVTLAWAPYWHDAEGQPVSGWE
jgi:hypothetical protein